MPRVITETRLAPELAIHLVRRQPRTPEGEPDGAPVWTVSLDAVVLDGAGEPVRAISVSDIADDLTTGERTSLKTLGAKVAQKLARRLDILEE